MPVIGIQGIKGGAGATSIVSGLGWALNALGKAVTLIDFSPENILRLHFNHPYDNKAGWAYALFYKSPWERQGFRYCHNLNFLPYGQLNDPSQRNIEEKLSQDDNFCNNLVLKLKKHHPNQWILCDIPSRNSYLSVQGRTACDNLIMVLNTDAQSQAQLTRLKFDSSYMFLINRFLCQSELQNDIEAVWQDRLSNILPVVVHEDQALFESLAQKSPVGLGSKDSMVANQMLSLATWCIANLGGY